MKLVNYAHIFSNFALVLVLVSVKGHAISPDDDIVEFPSSTSAAPESLIDTNYQATEVIGKSPVSKLFERRKLCLF